MIKLKIRPLLIFGAFSYYFVTANAQYEVISTDGRLSYDFTRAEQFIPIDATPGYPAKIVWVHQRPNFDFQYYYSIREGDDTWVTHPIAAYSNDRANIWSGIDGRTFIYIDYGLQYFENGDSLELRYGDTYDVMDSTGAFHFIYRDFEGAHLIFSRDTLAIWNFGDLLSSNLQQLGVAVSPDRGLVAAAFVDYNILNKYLAVAGQPLDTLNPIFSVFEFTPDDFTIDNDGNLFIAYSVLGDSAWKERYVWSERYGYRYLHSLVNSNINGPQAQFAFAPSRNLAFLLESNVYANYNSMDIWYTSDGGDSWIHSNIHPIGGNASTPRLAIDTLYIAAQLTDEYQVIFQKIPIDDVINSTGICGSDSPLPRLSLAQNYPNPFNSSTIISYVVPKNQYAELAIYDLAGRKVTTLFRGKNDGPNSVVWDTRNSTGNALSSGVYFCRLTCGESNLTRKLIYLK